MSHVVHLKRLGAPLKNPRKSWGSVREYDGVIFLLVWQDRVETIGGKNFVKATLHEHFDKAPNPAHNERVRHLDLIASGSLCYLIMCQARDTTAEPRTVKDFEAENAFLAGEIIERHGERLIEMVKRVPTRNLHKPPQS